jgi:hypothetical protein
MKQPGGQPLNHQTSCADSVLKDKAGVLPLMPVDGYTICDIG